MGACSVVCLKPSRLGGLGAGPRAGGVLRRSGIALWMGGMFESGYARGVNTTLAALPGFSWPGDLSPAGGYLGADLVPAPELDRSGPGRRPGQPGPRRDRAWEPRPTRVASGGTWLRHHRIEVGRA